MKILVTGAKGFVGKNLCAQLRNIRDGKAQNYGVTIDEVLEYDQGSPADLDAFCAEADFVFNLAGVNRPEVGKALIKSLRKHDLLKLSSYKGIVTELFELLSRKCYRRKAPPPISSTAFRLID